VERQLVQRLIRRRQAAGLVEQYVEEQGQPAYA
jgi:hypothetical protein